MFFTTILAHFFFTILRYCTIYTTACTLLQIFFFLFKPQSCSTSIIPSSVLNASFRCFVIVLIPTPVGYIWYAHVLFVKCIFTPAPITSHLISSNIPLFVLYSTAVSVALSSSSQLLRHMKWTYATSTVPLLVCHSERPSQEKTQKSFLLVRPWTSIPFWCIHLFTTFSFTSNSF